MICYFSRFKCQYHFLYRFIILYQFIKDIFGSHISQSESKGGDPFQWLASPSYWFLRLPLINNLPDFNKVRQIIDETMILWRQNSVVPIRAMGRSTQDNTFAQPSSQQGFVLIRGVVCFLPFLLLNTHMLAAFSNL